MPSPFALRARTDPSVGGFDGRNIWRHAQSSIGCECARRRQLHVRRPRIRSLHARRDSGVSARCSESVRGTHTRSPSPARRSLPDRTRSAIGRPHQSRGTCRPRRSHRRSEPGRVSAPLCHDDSRAKFPDDRSGRRDRGTRVASPETPANIDGLTEGGPIQARTFLRLDVRRFHHFARGDADG